MRLAALAVLVLALAASAVGAAPVNLTCTVSDADQVPLLRWKSETNAILAARTPPGTPYNNNSAASEALHRWAVEEQARQVAADANAAQSNIQKAKAWLDLCAQTSAQTKTDACAVTPATAASSAVCLCP